jgi:hypothetical protein
VDQEGFQSLIADAVEKDARALFFAHGGVPPNSRPNYWGRRHLASLGNAGKLIG